MADFDIDSTRLDKFFSYYKKNPEKWAEVELAVENKLKKIKEQKIKRRKENGGAKRNDNNG